MVMVMHSVTENELLQTVLEMAEAMGYVVYHVFEQSHYAKRTVIGFPDLVMYRPFDFERGWRRRLIVMELKSQRGVLTEQQQDWLSCFSSFKIETYIVRPSDLDSLENLLK